MNRKILKNWLQKVHKKREEQVQQVSKEKDVCGGISGHYREGMCFFDKEHQYVTEKQQKQIERLLLENSGVGIVAGYFDEKNTIYFISDLALAVLGFQYHHDFIRQTQREFASLFESQEEKFLFEKNLLERKEEVFLLYVKGYSFGNLPLQVRGEITEDHKGERMWIISIRRISEIQKVSETDCAKLLDELGSIGLFVVSEKDHRILYYNRLVQEVTPEIQIGISCQELWDDACEKGPISIIGQQTMAKMILYDTIFGKKVEASARRILWKNEIPAFLMKMSTCYEVSDIDSKDKGGSTSLKEDYFVDFLTGGYTRYGFMQMINNLVECRGNLTDYAVVFINIKGFKAINRLFGSEVGDRLLRILYSSIMHSFLAPQLGARKEADHFIFLVKKENLDLKRLSTILNFRWKYQESDIFVNCRAGIYYLTQKDEDIQEAMNRARLAKDYIKDGYIEPYAIFDEFMEVDYVQKAELLTIYERALFNKEFQVYYQPVVDIKTGKIVSAEALVRWNHPEKGFISPALFIPVLEEYGYITKVDHYVMHQVLKLLSRQYNNQEKMVPISINLSRMDFYDEWLLNEIKINSKKSDIVPPKYLRYEITETAYHALESQKSEFFNVMNEIGIKILLDDFGTGYSSFGMIQNFDFSILKIDISFIRQLEENPKVQKIVEAIIHMCHGLNIEVVAEGVETEGQLAVLKEIECDYVQGYYYSKPLEEKMFLEYLKEK